MMSDKKVPMKKGVVKGTMVWDHEVRNMETAGWVVDEAAKKEAVAKAKAEAKAKADTEKEVAAKAKATDQ